MMKQEYAKAMEYVGRLDQSLGGDPYLNVHRAEIRLADGNPEEARAFARRAISLEPSLARPYLILLNIALAEEAHDETLVLLKEIDQKFGTKHPNLLTDLDDAEFAKSPQHGQWLDYLKKKAKVQPPKQEKSPAPGAGDRPTDVQSRSGG
jgi:hypothetical protein